MPRVTPGNYVPLDVNYPHDPAIRRAGDAAELLFIRSLAYAKRTRNGGFVPSYDLEVVAVGLRNVQRRVASLVAERLWVETDDGWLIRSWERWNGTDGARSQASHLGNHTRWHVMEGKRDPECELCQASPPTRGATPNGTPIGTPPPISDGDIAREGKGREGNNTTAPRKRGARIPDAFSPDDAMREWAAEHTPGLDVDAATAEFVDYWRAVPGAKGTKLDWTATWRNRMREAHGRRRHLRTVTDDPAPSFWDRKVQPR